MFLLDALKIIFLLGFLIFIHEGGHFLVAKLCKVKVNEFSIGFGPKILKKQGKETLYALRLIPLGGFVSMEGEDKESKEECSFSNASIPKRIAIVAAGAIVNIVFGLIVYFILVLIIYNSFSIAFKATGGFILSIGESLRMIFTGNVGINDLTGPVGISEVVSKTTTFINYLSIFFNFCIIRGNKFTANSSIRWRKNLNFNNRSYKKKTIKTRNRNANSINRFFNFNCTFFGCNI